MKRLYAILAGLILLSLLFTACAPSGTEEPMAAQPTEEPMEEAEPIKIGASMPLTGMFSVAGAKHADGYQLCVDLINEKGGLLGRQVELLVSDNQSNTETAVAQYERFLNVDNVELVFGTFSSKLTFPATAVTEKAKIVHPVPSGGALQIWERGFEYIFYFQMNAGEYAGLGLPAALEAYRDAGVISADDFPKTAAVVWADDFFADAVALGLQGGNVEVAGTDKVVPIDPGFLEGAGIEVIHSERWPEGYTDWVTLANSIKAADAELLAAGTASPDEAIQLIRALQTVGYEPKAIWLTQGTQVEFLEAVGDASNGVMIFSAYHRDVVFDSELAGDSFSSADFIAAFNDKFGRLPDEDEAIPFALCQGMEQAVRGAGSTDNTAMRDWLAARTASDPVETIMGPFYWDERGLTADRYFLLTQWQDGELKFIFPTGEFDGVVDMVYPKPGW
jgi:branched-chain amino acid transport system substrate-binding protein